MAIRSLVTRGFGNGVFSGTIKSVVLRGYEIGDEPPPDTPDCYAGFNGQITGRSSYLGAIDDSSTAVIGEITQTLAVTGIVTDRAGFSGQLKASAGYHGKLDDADIGFRGDITDKQGFNGELCGC